MGRMTGCALVLLVAVAGSPPAQAATAQRGFPVDLEGTVELAPPVAFDIDGDGRLELLVGTRAKLHALEADGRVVAGFPVVFQSGAGLVTPLAAGSLGVERRPAIVFGTEDNALVVLQGSGAPWPGFPLKLKGRLGAAPTLADVDGDGRPEIVFGTATGDVYVVREDGRVLGGFPADAGAPVSSPVTVGRFRPGGDTLLLFGDERGRLHALNRSGKNRPGFPVRAEFSVASQPVLGDIDNDGAFEVVFGSLDFKIYAAEEDGSLSQGFPVKTSYRIYSTCALADIDGDGATDIVATSGDGHVYALAAGGRSLKGFPVQVGRRLRASPVVGDLDRDGSQEIVVGSDRNRIVVVRGNGRIYPGFPVRMADRVDVAPLLADLNADGLIEIVGVARNGSVGVFKTIKKGKTDRPLAWPVEGRDASRRGATYPNPPRYEDRAVRPAQPRTTDALEASYRFFDLDGDAEPRSRIVWHRNGKQVPELDGKKHVPAALTRKAESWYFTIQADAGAPVFKSAAVRILNSPPGSPRVALGPDPARTRDDLKMVVEQASRDPDGDTIQYRTTWLLDRVPQKQVRGPTVAARHTASGQRWTVVVTPFDGEVAGPPARASRVVVNSVPTAAAVRLNPPRPSVTQDVQVVVEKPGRDPDGDQVSYRYQWTSNGKELNLPRDASVLPAGLVAKHAKVQVEVTSFDGQGEGEKAVARAEVRNSPPHAPTVRILPAIPKTGDDLGVEIQIPALDPDGDVVGYTFEWSRKGTAYRGSQAKQARLPASETRRGDQWAVEVTPLDDEGPGKSARAEVSIANSPPPPPQLSKVNPRPTTTEDLTVTIDAKPQDPDDDKVTLRVTWYEGAREIARGTDLLRLPAEKTQKNRTYRVVVTPSDGKDEGESQSLWFEIQNSPPSGCAVEVKPGKPVTGVPLVCGITKRPIDPDQDRVQMRYRWYRNGQPVKPGKDPERMEGTRAGQEWTVVATPFDGEDEGPACLATVSVADLPPSSPTISLEPARPTAQDALSCRVVEESRDPEGKTVRLLHTWKVDGKPFPVASGTASVPRGTLRKGQRWEVEVVATDGENLSPAARAAVEVVNSPPGAPRVSIRPEAPLSSEDLHCRLIAPTPDPDGDALQHAYAWYLLKKKQKKPRGKPVHTGATLPAARTRKDQTWLCRVQASDDQVAGATAGARVRVSNAAPTPPRVEIRPQNPGAGQSLRCVIAEAARDPDGDRVRYEFRWTKDGVVRPFAAQTDQVPARLTKVHDIWQCSVTASDGSARSAAAEAQEVVVLGP